MIATVCLLALYPTVKYIIPAVLPFALAVAVSSLSIRFTARIGVKTPPGKALCASFTALLFYALVFLCLFAAGREITRQIYLLCADAPSAAKKISEFISELPEKLSVRLFPESAEKFAPIISAAIKNAAASFVSGTAKLLGRFASALPALLLFFTVLVTATFYLCADGGKTLEKLSSLSVAQKLKTGALGLTGKMARAYGTLLLLTFSELFFGFSVIGIKYPLLLASLIAFIDILPILGVGTVLLPWATVNLALGNAKNAVLLVLLWAVTLTVRQLAEPKLVGERLGIPPLLSIAAMYAGIKIFGAPGVLLAPMAAAIIPAFIRKSKEDNPK